MSLKRSYTLPEVLALLSIATPHDKCFEGHADYLIEKVIKGVSLDTLHKKFLGMLFDIAMRNE